jgi:Ca-activated chloride channel family protein
MLDKMAADNGGTRNYVTPNEDIEVAVSSLFRKMNEPVLVDVGINFGQILTKELTPKNLPDLFREEQLTILGRYEGQGNTALKLRGVISSERHEFSKDIHFSALELDNDFLPHLWAQRRIAELVDEAALNGRTRELDEEIERLSKAYGVLTPYTSFTSANDGSLRNLYGSRISDAYTEAMPMSDRIEYTREIEERKSARHKRQDANTRYIGRKTFHRHGNMWVDIEYDGTSERQIVEFGSEAYYELMNDLRGLARYSKLAKDALTMIICYEGVNYEITPPTV